MSCGFPDFCAASDILNIILTISNGYKCGSNHACELSCNWSQLLMCFAAKGLPLLDQNETPPTMTVTSGSVPWVTLLLFKISLHFLCQCFFEFHGNWIKEHWMRALASHQCGLGSNPGDDASAILWVEFAAGFLLCPETFFSRYSGFPFSSKINISKFQFDQESGRQRMTLWMCYFQIIIYVFVKAVFSQCSLPGLIHLKIVAAWL